METEDDKTEKSNKEVRFSDEKAKRSKDDVEIGDKLIDDDNPINDGAPKVADDQPSKNNLAQEAKIEDDASKDNKEVKPSKTPKEKSTSNKMVKGMSSEIKSKDDALIEESKDPKKKDATDDKTRKYKKAESTTEVDQAEKVKIDDDTSKDTSGKSPAKDMSAKENSTSGKSKDKTGKVTSKDPKGEKSTSEKKDKDGKGIPEDLMTEEKSKSHKKCKDETDKDSSKDGKSKRDAVKENSTSEKISKDEKDILKVVKEVFELDKKNETTKEISKDPKAEEETGKEPSTPGKKGKEEMKKEIKKKGKGKDKAKDKKDKKALKSKLIKDNAGSQFETEVSKDVHGKEKEKKDAPLVVVGGGIAGVTCAKTLSLDNPNQKVLLISSSPIVKVVSNLKTLGRAIDVFDVIEKNFSAIQDANLKVEIGKVIKLNANQSTLVLENKRNIKYSRLCICTGATPKVIPYDNPACAAYIKCIRDTHTAKDFQAELASAKRIVLLGNGGIATELVYELMDIEIIWVMKDDSFGATFFDSTVSRFFTDFLLDCPDKKIITPSKRHMFETDDTTREAGKQNNYGVALGPDWHTGIELKGNSDKNVRLEKNCEVVKVYPDLESIPIEKHQNLQSDETGNLYVELSNGRIIVCDILVSATGVIPNNEVFLKGNSFKRGPDGGLLVTEEMKTTVKLVYAAGDCCTANWKKKGHWFQMRLWTQARQMGYYAAKCITAHLTNTSPALYFNFEVFAHVTKFFGLRVALLGLFNAQTLNPKECKVICRATPKEEFVKVILVKNKLKGAILVGDTKFEETFENLIYTQMDLTKFREHLLDEILDVEDYFD